MVHAGAQAHEVADMNGVMEVDPVYGRREDVGAAEAVGTGRAASSMSFMMIPPWMFPM